MPCDTTTTTTRKPTHSGQCLMLERGVTSCAMLDDVSEADYELGVRPVERIHVIKCGRRTSVDMIFLSISFLLFDFLHNIPQLQSLCQFRRNHALLWRASSSTPQSRLKMSSQPSPSTPTPYSLPLPSPPLPPPSDHPCNVRDSSRLVDVPLDLSAHEHWKDRLLLYP